MRYRFIARIAVVMGLMVSPISLVLLGNNMGTVGISFFIGMCVALIVHIPTALVYGKLFTQRPSLGSESEFIKETLGTFPAIVFPLCSRVVCAICASTGLLVTAGFVFNEVFVYWFPNFAFAFLLLGVILVLNLSGEKISGMIQIICVLVVIIGLITLSVAGVLKLEDVSLLEKEVSFASSVRAGLLALFLYIGFDLGGFAYTGNSDGTHHGDLGKPMVVGIILVGGVFCMWGLVSALYVPPDTLANTSIPYTITARKILGQPGRIIIGLVIIAGVCSAVNALFGAVSKMIHGMVTHGLLPQFFRVGGHRAPLFLFLLATGVALMMVVGVAGNPDLDIYIRAGLLFWLLNYAVFHVSVFTAKKRFSHNYQIFHTQRFPIAATLCVFVLVCGFFWLLWSDNNSNVLITFMLFVFALISVLSLIWIVLKKRLKII